MKPVLPFFFAFVLSFSLVMAVQVNTNKVEYSASEPVSVSITSCVGISALQILNAQSGVIDVNQGTNNWTASYHTLSDSSRGRYTIQVSCADGTSTTRNFCVDAPGCIAVAAECGNGRVEAGEVCDNGANNGACPASCSNTCTQNQCGTPQESTGGGGGRRCRSEWSCSEWSYCNSSLQQSRTCTDIEQCSSKPKIETQACLKCDESWVCSLWSDCQSGRQNRICRDEHICGTTTLKPLLEKACSQSVAGGFPPASTVPQSPSQFAQSYPAVQQPNYSFWQQYGAWISGGLLGIIVLFGLTFLVLHVVKGRHKAYNYDELVEWIGKEKEMGTSDQDIREILARETGWHPDEISEAFKDLRKNLVSNTPLTNSNETNNEKGSAEA